MRYNSMSLAMQRVFFFFFFCFFCFSCGGTSYLCWNEDKTEAMAFSYDETFGNITVGDRISFSILNAQKTPLNSNMPGGSHTIKMDKSSIILEYIQDSVYSRTQLPSGRFVENYNEEIKTKEDYKKQIIYHAVYPVVWKHVFDKKQISLFFYANPLPKPRSATELRYNPDNNPSNPRSYFKKVRDLNPEEAAQLLQLDKHSYTKEYPQCENETFSFKRIVRSILRTLLFP